jgi:hypothetical protein
MSNLPATQPTTTQPALELSTDLRSVNQLMVKHRSVVGHITACHTAMMDIFFADDSIQGAPTRQGMTKLVGVGGVYVPAANVNTLERTLNQLCANAGFPPGEEFKWSPGREDWMWGGLVRAGRADFFQAVIQSCIQNNAKTVVVASDTRSRFPMSCDTHETFVVQMLIERIESLAVAAGHDTLVVFDRPGGAAAQEDAFLARCLETIQDGTKFVRPTRIALNALSTSSHFIRLLQVADMFTGCVMAYLSGESRYAPPIMDAIRPTLATSTDRVGGVGIKIHPDFWYVNLYHWLFGDAYLVRGNIGHPLPLPNFPYARNADDR